MDKLGFGGELEEIIGTAYLAASYLQVSLRLFLSILVSISFTLIFYIHAKKGDKSYHIPSSLSLNNLCRCPCLYVSTSVSLFVSMCFLSIYLFISLLLCLSFPLCLSHYDLSLSLYFLLIFNTLIFFVGLRV